MKSFIIKKMNCDLELDTFNYKFKGFKYKTNSNRAKQILVKEVIVVKPELVNILIEYSFDKNYKKILEIYLSAMGDDEDSEGKLMIALDEIARLRSIIIKKYRNVLNKKMEEKFFKRLKLLENELRTKVIDIRMIKEQELALTMEEERGRGR